MDIIGIMIDKETASQLLKVLEHQFIDYEYNRVHELIKQMQKFIETK